MTMIKRTMSARRQKNITCRIKVTIEWYNLDLWGHHRQCEGRRDVGESCLCWVKPSRELSCLCWVKPSRELSCLCWVKPSGELSCLCWVKPSRELSCLCWVKPSRELSSGLLDACTLDGDVRCLRSFTRVEVEGRGVGELIIETLRAQNCKRMLIVFRAQR